MSESRRRRGLSGVDRRHHRRAADACPELAIPRFINRHIVSLGIGSLFLLLIGVWGQFFLIAPDKSSIPATTSIQRSIFVIAAIVLFGLVVARLAERPRIPNKASAHLELERPLPSPDEPTRHEKHRLTTAIVLF